VKTATRLTLALATGLATSLASLALQAQPLPDPTRPMGAARSLAPQTPATAGLPTRTPAATLRAPAPARIVPTPRLQALMSPVGGPRSAMLDGVVLSAGQSLGADWRLERIGDDGVLLRRTSPDTATLWLPLLGDARPHKEP
jgi:hypothetical protein